MVRWFHILHYSFILGKSLRSKELGLTCLSYSVVLSVKEVFNLRFCCIELNYPFSFGIKSKLVDLITIVKGYLT